MNENSTLKTKNRWMYALLAFILAAMIAVPAIFGTSPEAATVGTVKLRTIKANSSTKVTLTWNKVSGASGYRVYRKTSGSSWKGLKNVGAAKRSYTDATAKAGTRYTYTVRAYKRVNGKNYWGSYNKKGLTVTTPRGASIGTVKLRAIKANASNKITLTWNKVSGASGYRIYRKTNGSGWKGIRNVGASARSFVDTSVKAGTRYTYTVRAYKRVGGKNYWGKYNTKGLTATTPKAASTSVGTVKLRAIKANASNKITLTWNKVSGASGYRVYRKTGSSGWKGIKNVGSSATSYTDTSVKAGTKYTYTVRAYKRVSGKNYWGKYNTKGLTATTPKAANVSVGTVKLRAIKANASNKITLTWNKVSGASGYRVYRKTGSSGWTALRNVGASTLSYVDTSVKAGTRYTYTVKAYKNANGKTYWGSYNKNGLTATTPACKHSYKTTVTKNATCTAAGTKKLTCSLCGYSKTETVKALGHDLKTAVTKAATCGETGVKTTTCSRCSYKTTETIPATGKHTLKESVTKQPTCGDAGVKEVTCSKCGYKTTETIPATGEHIYGEWTIATPATCGDAGVKTRTCTVCGQTAEEAVPATGVHNWIDHEETGHYETTVVECGSAQVCNQCGKTYIYRDLLEKYGVTEAEVTAMEYEVVDDAYEAAGLHVLTTQGCNNWSSKSVPVNHQQYVVDQAAYTECSVCGARK